MNCNVCKRTLEDKEDFGKWMNIPRPPRPVGKGWDPDQEPEIPLSPRTLCPECFGNYKGFLMNFKFGEVDKDCTIIAPGAFSMGFIPSDPVTKDSPLEEIEKLSGHVQKQLKSGKIKTVYRNLHLESDKVIVKGLKER